MKLVVFGANGQTGRLLTSRALAAGHPVVAVALSGPVPDCFCSRVRSAQEGMTSPERSCRRLSKG
jgi:putative NADH-flavin reductase